METERNPLSKNEVLLHAYNTKSWVGQDDGSAALKDYLKSQSGVISWNVSDSKSWGMATEPTQRLSFAVGMVLRETRDRHRFSEVRRDGF